MKKWLAKQGVFNKKGLKLVIFTVAGLAILLGLAYLVSLTIHQDIRERTIIGIWGQVLAGFVLVIDQATQRVKEASPNAFAKWFEAAERKPSKLSILASLVISTFGIFLWVCLSDFKGLTWTAVGGAVIMFFIWYDVYLYSLKYVTKYVARLQAKFGENHMRIRSEEFADSCGNLVLLIVSTALLVSFFSIASVYANAAIWIQAVVVLFLMIAGLVALPNFLLSFMYFAVLVYIKVFLFMKRKIPRVVFWAFIFVFWTWGGALLLINAYQ